MKNKTYKPISAQKYAISGSDLAFYTNRAVTTLTVARVAHHGCAKPKMVDEDKNLTQIRYSSKKSGPFVPDDC